MATVLLVEDDTTLANALLYALQSAGFQTCHATSLRDGLASHTRHQPDLVVLDVMLPDGDAAATGGIPVLRSGGVEVHLAESAATRDGRPIHLTPAEYRILCHLLRHPGQVLSRESILGCLGDGGPLVVDDNTLSVYMRRLREKVETDASAPRRIVTVRGFGYRWVADA